ncbi:transposase [Shewanella sedimentimangrovi]|uniref:Transposase n=1 Tax=Shewanella sedimentimangrovi TaxID=2814293 RepID=A0ABX7R0A4_9GAMM|nr:transposase [Shewanella sedimentimangrovi]QSX37217.1 transposase [Shewanella sedimentimangrovi]
MTTARRQLIDAESTPFYHVINRCVRRAFLCGEDTVSGRSFEHRRGWIVDKIRQLSSIFCIDVCAYAVMSNHYHLVLKIDLTAQKALSPFEVIERWTRLFSGNLVAAKFLKGDSLSDGEAIMLNSLIAEWQERLGSISWFMRCLNEEIARKANREDGCKGVFWEGRFKSQALLDEQALLACMMYVDLNPIRAGITDSLQGSDYTSIQERLDELHGNVPSLPIQVSLKTLLPFDGAAVASEQHGIPFHLADYLELIDWTGRAVREDKRGVIDSARPKLLTELGIRDDAWITSAREFRRQYGGISGRWDSMCAMKAKSGGKWCRGKYQSEALHPR